MIIATLGLIGLFFYMKYKPSEVYNKDGGFTRTKKIEGYSLKIEVPLPEDRYVFIKRRNDWLYVRSLNAPTIFKIPLDSFDVTKVQKYDLKSIVKADNISSVQLSATGDTLYVFAGSMKTIFAYDLTKRRLVRKIQTKDFFFSGNVIGNDFLLQLQEGSTMNSKFTRFSVTSKGILNPITRKDLILKGMGESGYVHIIDSTKFAFVSSFCNHMYISDYSKDLIIAAKTIDTASVIPATVMIPGKDIVTFAEQPRLINNTIFTDNGYLYVHSLVKSRNDDPDALRHQTIIDKYDSSTGKYLETLYAPSSFNKIADDVLISGDTTYEFYGGTLLIYEFDK
jgi:hypothetical protein